MENHIDIQNQIFQKIIDQLPPHVSLVDEISDFLEISTDSAYRRIRGEKPLSIYEVQKLCEKYRFSVDDLASTSINTVTFRTNLLSEEYFNFTDYFKSLLNNIQAISAHEQAEVIFLLNELNLFQLIQVPEICAFKLYYWQKSNLSFPGYRDKLFTFDILNDEIIKLASEITEYYTKLRTIELATEEILISLLKQVLFYNEAGLFKTKKDAKLLCEKLIELVEHLKRQAELGFKFVYGKKPVGREGNYLLYYNEIVLIDQIVLVKAGDNESTYITNNGINLLQTYNKAFFEYNYQWCKNLIQKSTLISGTGEKERNKYFIKLYDKIQNLINKID
jgi:hypothetical protein